MPLRPFRIEQHYAERQFMARSMWSSDCESRPVGDLLQGEPGADAALHELWCGYTESPGAPSLRDGLAAGYEGLDRDDTPRAGFGRADMPEALARLEVHLG